MEAITYENIKISGIKYNKISSLRIYQSVNNHARAEFTCQLPVAEGKSFVDREYGNKVINITTSAEGQPKTLFCGTIASAGISDTGGYGLLEIKLLSTSSKLDLKPESKTFQNTSLTYEDVLNSVIKGTGTVNVTVTDKPIGQFVLQYKETDWSFIKRMASQLQASVFTSTNSEKPNISVGLPQGGRIVKIKGVDYSGSKGTGNSSEAMNVSALEYCYLGERINLNGMIYTIGTATSVFDDARLVTSYGIYKNNGFVQAPIYNPKSSGRMFLGSVKAVEGDKVQVHFSEIDSDYDGGGTQWFPYSTVYASSDGSGFYCMPEVGDMVRVFMPSNNEKDAFVSGAVNNNPQDNPRHKSWKAPGGKEILLTDDGIYIICEKEKIYINLSKDEGIEIRSNKMIEISSDEGISVQSYNSIVLRAESQINMEVGNSSLLIDKEQISMTANNVYVN